ncbi:hypothetical protein EVAR_8798_1 [Eumeta japonica]|uniref:Uncharacterized protein n=1 Tax=Eumeta variegata TaxID=151549 RepID=A0A4C1TTU7_EUMVA|nr:hypothetical protein EVAR_8798_1 [Eumeta japonica]
MSRSSHSVSYDSRRATKDTNPTAHAARSGGEITVDPYPKRYFDCLTPRRASGRDACAPEATGRVVRISERLSLILMLCTYNTCVFNLCPRRCTCHIYLPCTVNFGTPVSVLRAHPGGLDLPVAGAP